MLSPLQARNAIVIAIIAKLAFKLAAVRIIVTARLARWTALGFSAIVLAGLAALLI